MLQSHVPERAGELAARLCRLAGGDFKKAFFCSSGSEGVESAIKFSRVFTGRKGLLYTQGAFHGLTCGALSLMGDPFWKKGFGPMLSDTEEIPFGDESALAEKLKTKKFAAFVVEPMQGEGGIRVPSASYVKRARELCTQYGTLLVFDEVQTGFYRTGKFLAAHHYGVDADIVILAKALSGGLIPSGAVLMTDAIYNAVYGSLKKIVDSHVDLFGKRAGDAGWIGGAGYVGKRKCRVRAPKRWGITASPTARATRRIRHGGRDSRRGLIFRRLLSRRRGNLRCGLPTKRSWRFIRRCSGKCW